MTTKNGDMPAMPMAGNDIDTQEDWNEITGGGRFIPVRGITKREMMAMHMMASCRSRNSDYMSWEDMAKDAIEITDALLAELERTK